MSIDRLTEAESRLAQIRALCDEAAGRYDARLDWYEVRAILDRPTGATS